jgi:hypothetical protein
MIDAEASRNPISEKDVATILLLSETPYECWKGFDLEEVRLES